MTRRAAAALAPVALLGAAAAPGCRRPAPAAPAPAPLVEEYCWWTAFRTPLPPDSVAARYAAAYQAVGLAVAGVLRRGDTVAVAAGPTPVALPGPRDTVTAPAAARVVAFRRGDSTLFRHYVSLPAAAGGERRIPLCGRIGGAARAGGLAPREPGPEERRAVWGTTPVVAP